MDPLYLAAHPTISDVSGLFVMGADGCFRSTEFYFEEQVE